MTLLGAHHLIKYAFQTFWHIFGSNRSPRRGDLVCACVCLCVTFLKRTWKRSSRELKKGSRRKQACMQAGRHASRNASRLARKQAGKQAGRQASNQGGMQAGKEVSSKALGMHAVRAMPWRGLLLLRILLDNTRTHDSGTHTCIVYIVYCIRTFSNTELCPLSSTSPNPSQSPKTQSSPKHKSVPNPLQFVIQGGPIPLQYLVLDPIDPRSC